ncbi:MAG TPA: hypothetical protein VFY45_20845 [Baekduia sp.]|nr:hypothetical protein [Baekduia sp.]
MKRLVGMVIVGTLLALPSAAAAKSGCPVRDVRTMLVEAGQGMNGRVLALRETSITVLAESTYKDSIKFGETVRIYGKSLPGLLQGRIGIVVRREGERWTARRCDVVPGWRMANALSGRPPCPKPRVRISHVRTEGLVAHVTLQLAGDITTLRLDSGQKVRRRHFSEPGMAMIVEDFRYSKTGSYHAKIRAEGGFGPGCGTARKRYSATQKTITIG